MRGGLCGILGRLVAVRCNELDGLNTWHGWSGAEVHRQHGLMWLCLATQSCPCGLRFQCMHHSSARQRCWSHTLHGMLEPFACEGSEHMAEEWNCAALVIAAG